MFPPIYPIRIQTLDVFHPYAPFIWLAGVLLLGLTRYTHQMGRRWGYGYYFTSALLRPIGIVLIAAGWMALFSPISAYPMPEFPTVGWLPSRSFTDVLCWLAIGAFFGLDIWAMATLGLRQSFFYRRLEDKLIVTGPYRFVRHPQFLSAVGISFFLVKLYNPAEFPTFAFGAYLHSVEANWALFTLSLWMLTFVEERELAIHFGEEYREYQRSVPRLIPL